MQQIQNRFLSIYLVLLLSLASYTVLGQNVAKTPSLMILPSDNWCTMRYYTQTLDNQGSKTVVTDYARAFREDIELGPVISQIGGILAEKGFIIKDVEQAVKNLQIRTAENNVTQSRNGDILAETDLDVIKNQVRADIMIQVYWHVIKQGDGKSVQFTLEAFDCYSDMRIPATITGIGKAGNSSIPVLLANEIKKNIDNFTQSLQSYYDGLSTKGRAIKVNIRRWSGWDKDLDSEFDNITLLDIIEDWISEHAFQGSYNLTGSTADIATFEQVQIAAFDQRGRAVDARRFCSQLRIYLKNKYAISSKILNRGMGEVTLVLGE